MSYSSLLIHRPRLFPLESIGGSRTPTINIVCCCPWPGSGSGSNFGSDKNKENILSSDSGSNFGHDTNKKNGSSSGSGFNSGTNKKNTHDSGSGSGSNTSSSRKKIESHVKRLPLPPGPSLLHLIGLLPFLIQSLPYHYPFTALAKTYGPLLHFEVGQLPVVVVSSPEIAKHVLKTHDVACANRPRSAVSDVMTYGNRDIFATPYGEYWKQMRHVSITELLSLKNVRSLDYIRRDEGSALVDGIRSTAGAPLDLTEKIFRFMNSVICTAVFGNAPMERAGMSRLIRATLAAGTEVDVADVIPSLNFLSWNGVRFLKLRQEMDDMFNSLIDKHRKNLAVTGKGYGQSGTEDFVDVLLRLGESDDLRLPITDDTIKAILLDIFAGGTETTSSVVDWTMTELVRNPRVMAKLQAEIREAFDGRKTMEESEIGKLSYLKVVVKEAMRLHPPSPLIVRACREEIEIDGYRIPKNAAIVVNLWWLGRDPGNWRKPEKFEPERFEGNSVDFLGNHFEYIPFGSGKRKCPGIPLAVANIQFLLAHLLYYFDWKLPLGMKAEDLDMMESAGISSSRKSRLHLIATPYSPAFDNIG